MSWVQYYYQGEIITDVKEWCRKRGEEILVIQWKRTAPRAVVTDKGLSMEMKEWVEEEEIPEPIWRGINSSMENNGQLGTAKIIARYKP